MPQGQDSNRTVRIKGQLPIVERQLVDQVGDSVRQLTALIGGKPTALALRRLADQVEAAA
jgi:hypothetical protein